MKNSNRIIILNILSTVIIQGLNFFTMPIFSRVLGVDNYGIVSIYATWVLIMTAVFSLEAGSSLNMGRIRFSLEEQPQYQSSILSLGTFSYVCFSILVVIFSKQLAALMKLDHRILMAMLVHSYGQFCVGLLNGKFTYEFKAARNFILSVVTSVSSIGLSLILIYQLPASQNYWGRILGQSITYGLLSVAVWLVIFPKGKTLFSKEYWKFCLPLTLPVIFHMLANHILGQTDRIMLQHMIDDAEVGIYSLASSFSVALCIVWTALNNSWTPFYMEYSKQNRIPEMLKRAKNYLELFTVLASGFILLTPEVYHVFADSDFWGGTNLIPILAIGYYMVFLYSFAVNYEFFHQQTRLIATNTAIAAVLNIVLNYFFIRLWGGFGAALATATAHTMQFIIHYLMAKFAIKNDEFPFKLRTLLPYTAVFMVVAIGCIVLPIAWYIRWGVGAVIGVWELYRIYKRKQIF